MKILRYKAFESLDVMSVDVPIESAVWCAHFYLDSNRFSLTGRPEITPEMFVATQDLLKKYSDGYLYRGITVYESEYQEAKKEGYITTKYVPSSWSWDPETAKAFAVPNPGDVGLLLKYPIKNLKNYLSIDVVMENVDEKELQQLKKEEQWIVSEVENYVSESEIIVFDDHMRIVFKDVKVIKPTK
jgi:hypothetical protein